MNTYLSGTGSALPERIISNSYFENHTFYDKEGHVLPKPTPEVVSKLEMITGIKERRYISEDVDSVPLMVRAAKAAIEDAGIDKNEIGGIIVAHNAGNMVPHREGFHPVPNLAANLKHGLGITNHEMSAYDILFGCPGWIQGLIQAHRAIIAGDTDHVLVVGLEVASRMLDPHDVDSMIFADGCGAAIVSANDQMEKGILSYKTFSHAEDDLMNIYIDRSNNPDLAGDLTVKMNGREVYRYATTYLPQVIKAALDKAEKSIKDVDMFLFHQANEKMLHAIAHNIARVSGQELSFEGMIPMTIHQLGNTSVATVPTMLDMIRNEKLNGYQIKEGDLVVMASVGAGMHCNAMVYQF